MTKRYNFILSIAVALFSFTASASTPMTDYSADLETVTPEGAYNSRIYSKNGKERMENGVVAREGITIIRPDKKVVWMLMPQEKTFMELPMDIQQNRGNSGTPNTQGPNIKAEKEFIANETVDGHPVRKYHVKLVMEGKSEYAGYLWEATDLGDFAVKYQNEAKNLTTTLKNIRFGNIPDALFELPSGYRKMEPPSSPGGQVGPMSGKGSDMLGLVENATRAHSPGFNGVKRANRN